MPRILYSLESIIIFYLYTTILLAQEKANVFSSGMSYLNNNNTLEQVKRDALSNARSDAIRQAVGVIVNENIYRTKGEILSSSQNETFDNFSKINRETSFARIVNEKILRETTSFQDGKLVYRVDIEAEVIKEKGLPDSFFNAELKLNKDVFYVDKNGNGEKILLNIFASKDCYIYLFNITSNDSVKLLIPNEYFKDNFYSIADNGENVNKQLDRLEFSVELPLEKNSTLEALCLIAMKEKHDFNEGSYAQTSKKFIKTCNAAYIDIQNWLIGIPLNQRAEAFQSFEIRRRK